MGKKSIFKDVPVIDAIYKVPSSARKKPFSSSKYPEKNSRYTRLKGIAPLHILNNMSSIDDTLDYTKL